MTLEEAQAEIVRLQEELATANTERQNLTEQNANLTKEMDKVKTINQQYFLKLSAQYNPQPTPDADNGDDNDDVPTCEDFAKTLNI